MMRINNIVKQSFFYPVLLMGWLLLSPQSGWAFKKKIDPRFEARKKQGVAQLKQLIRQNKENNRKGLGHQNWYIIGDPVHLVGEQVLLNSEYGMFTPKQIQEANNLLNAYNQSKGAKVVFYAYLTGFKVPLASPLNSIDAKDYPEFEGKKFREFYKELNRRRKKIQQKEAQAYEAKLLNGIFTEVRQEIGSTKNLVVYGHTIYLDPRLTEAKELKYGTEDFINFVMDKQASASYQYRFKGLGNLMKGITRRADETSSAHHLRAHIKAGIKVFKGNNDEVPNPFKKYSAAWFARMTTPVRISEQWNKDIQGARKMLQEYIQNNQTRSFRQRKTGEHNFERRYIIGKYRVDRFNGGPVLSPEQYTILNDKMVLLEEKTGIRYYVLYYQVNYYIPKKDPDYQRDRTRFMQAVLQGMSASLNEKTVILCVPFFRAMAEVKEKGRLTTKLKSFGFPQLYHGSKLPEALQQTFAQFKKGTAQDLILGIYRDIPKPHVVYAQYFRLDGQTMYNKVEDAKQVTGFKNIYEFHLLIDKRLPEMYRVKGSLLSVEIARINAAKPEFKPYKHGLREAFITNQHRAFALQHISKYTRVYDFLQNVTLPPKVPRYAFVKPPKAPDLIEDILDYSSLLLGLAGLDAIPETIGLVYAHIKGDDQAKLKYLIGISTAKIGGILLKRISGKDIVKFMTRNPKVWVKYTSDKGAAATLKKVKITKLKNVNWQQNDDVLDVVIHAEGNTYKALIEKSRRTLEVNLNEKSLAGLIESVAKSPDQPVRLLSCSNFASAQKLSKHLDRPVIATDALVRVHPDGGITTIARSGNGSQKWYQLEGGKRVEVSPPKKPESRYKGDFVLMGKESLDAGVERKLSSLNIDKDAFLKDYQNPQFKQAMDKNPELVEGWKVLKDYPQRIDIPHLEFFSNKKVQEAFAWVKNKKPNLFKDYPNMTPGEIAALNYYSTSAGYQLNFYLRGLPTSADNTLTGTQMAVFKQLMDSAIEKLPNYTGSSVLLRLEGRSLSELGSFKVGQAFPYDNFISAAKDARSSYLISIQVPSGKKGVLFEIENNGTFKVVDIEKFSQAGAASIGNEREVLLMRGINLETTKVEYKKYPVADEKSIIKGYINDGAPKDAIPSSVEIKELRQELLDDWITDVSANPNAIPISRYATKNYTPSEYEKATKILTVSVRVTKK